MMRNNGINLDILKNDYNQEEKINIMKYCIIDFYNKINYF